MKAHTTLSIRSARSLALGMLLSATLASGCDSDDEPETLEISSAVPTTEVAAPSPAFQCQNGVRVSVWNKVLSPGVAPGVLIGTNPDEQCPPGVDASAD